MAIQIMDDAVTLKAINRVVATSDSANTPQRGSGRSDSPPLWNSSAYCLMRR
jgi:hypothetical protein